MIAESPYSGVARDGLARKRFSKYVPVATDTHATLG
jgi:hypothetical protein